MKGFAQLGRLARTARWLKPRQVWGRVAFRLARPRADASAPPRLRAASTGSRWVTPAARAASLTGPSRMCFLADEADLDQVGWDDPSRPLLWRYNQHYFDDLNAVGAAHRQGWHAALLQRWMAENLPPKGTAWAPYPTSLRIVNWVKWFMADSRNSEAVPEGQHSLAVQARWLAQRLEWHLLGNHLFANAKALMFAGLWFEGVEADRWLATALRILQTELHEQILPDGAQFERSPMYHALALEDVLDLLNLLAARPGTPADALAATLRQHASAMLHWLRCMRHPGGGLARFNDCAEGIAPDTDDIERYAAALGIAAAYPAHEIATVLQPSGYVRLARGPALALLDCAPVGPDYMPGHAHADTLSFELSVHGAELLVNRGTSVYGTGPRRQIERGTALHNTVQIGANDSSEVWAGFRVGRRARVTPAAVDGFSVRCSHDGYTHLPGVPKHHRHWLLEDDGLLVEDHLQPAPAEPAVARFHLAPGLQAEPLAAGQWRLTPTHPTSPGPVPSFLFRVLQGQGRVTQTLHARRFGQLVPATTLEVTLQANAQGAACRVRVEWNADTAPPATPPQPLPRTQG